MISKTGIALSLIDRVEKTDIFKIARTLARERENSSTNFYFKDFYWIYLKKMSEKQILQDLSREFEMSTTLQIKNVH